LGLAIFFAALFKDEGVVVQVDNFVIGLDYLLTNVVFLGVVIVLFFASVVQVSVEI